MLDGTEIIVDANSEIEMKRFIRNGNMNEGNAFKFIERTTAIEDGPRGIKVDDGVIRVEFCFEQAAAEVITTHYRDIYHYPYYGSHPYGGGYYGSFSSGAYNAKSVLRGTNNASIGNIAQAMNVSGSTLSGNSISISNTSATSTESLAAPAEVNDTGITVPGSKVEQKFSTVYGFKAEAQSHVIILRLTGVSGDVEITKPVTVKAKQKCETCGKVNKATSKFCSSCGTSLILL